MSRDLSELYKIASDPSTNRKELVRIWNETKSSKVRRAVASNLNCDPDTMRIAARLYLKEVVNNPSFEMLKLFGEDSFITNLFEAYEKPDVFSKTKHVRNYNKDQILLARAVLMSPNLSSYESVDTVYNVLSITDIKRELKDETVKERVRKVSMGGRGLTRLNPSTVLDLYNSGVITLTKFDSYLSSCQPRSISHGSGGSIKRLLESQIENLTPNNYELVFKLIVACNTYNVKSAIKSALSTSNGDKFLPILSSLLDDLIYFDTMRLRKANKNNNSYYGYRADSGSHSYHVYSALWKFIKDKHFDGVADWSKVDFNAMMADINKSGLRREYNLYDVKWGVKSEGGVVNRLALVENLLSIKSDDDFVFVLSNLLKDPEFFPKSVVGSVDERILSRIGKIDSYRFEKGLPLLVCKSHLASPSPIVEVNRDYCGYQYYGLRKSHHNYLVVPQTSGLISQKLIDKYVEKSR